jgi:putative hydrolase of the HAD superfamily
MKPRYLLCDLDQTVYPASSGLLAAIARRMTVFVSDFLQIGPEEAVVTRRELSARYGTTVLGLLELHGLGDPAGYMAYVHDLDVSSYLKPDPELRAALTNMPCPAAILTNSPADHARRVLDSLGIADCFEHVFDIRFNNYRGKPALSAYKRVLEAIRLAAEEVLFVDDRLDYLLPFRGLGGQVVLCAENGGRGGVDMHPVSNVSESLASVASLKELAALLASCGGP